METYLVLLIALAVTLALVLWRKSLELTLYRSALVEAQERAAVAEMRVDSERGVCERLQGELDGHGIAFETLHSRYGKMLAEKDAAAARERHELLERIQRPHEEPVPVLDGSLHGRRLHWSEDDEIDGKSVASVASEAGLSEAHERTIAHIDEIAVTEGAEPG